MNDTRFKVSFIKKDGTEKEVEFQCNTFEIRQEKGEPDSISLFEYIKNPKDNVELDKLWNALDIGDSDVSVNMSIDGEYVEIFHILQVVDTNMDFVPTTAPEYTMQDYRFMKTLRMC